MRILIAGWTGSTNLGDELVLRGIRELLGTGHRVAAISIDPATTRRDHGIAAVDHRRLDHLATATRSADLVIFGGGGLVQDETSPWNLPYHLSRPLLAHLGGTPWAALGLGVGPLDSALGRRLAATLRDASAVTVRDGPSQDLLTSLGVTSRLGADAAFHLADTGDRDPHGSGSPAPRVDVEGFPAELPYLAVSLRPWLGGAEAGSRRWLPVGWRPADGAEPEWFVPTVASTLDRTSRRTGLAIRFVAMQTDRDARLHERVAATMRAPATTVVPTLGTVLDELAGARAVVAMRYHSGIGATLAGRPSVLIGYSPKVDALAETLGDGAAHLAFDREQLAAIDDAVVGQLGAAHAVTAVVAARAELRARARVDADVLAELGA